MPWGGAIGSSQFDQMRWAFNCHCPGDPVLPGALLVEAMLPLLGFLAVAHGFKGRARAAGARDVRFRHAVPPGPEAMTVAVSVRRLSRPRQLLVADGKAQAGGISCATVRGLTLVVVPLGETNLHPDEGTRRS
jgi:3-hydroxymyristoyl/3-hydroxydecanoyl-(acyl carrier protein) dehydratase